MNFNLNFNLNSPREIHRNIVSEEREEREEILNGYNVKSRYNVDRITENEAIRDGAVFSPPIKDPVNLNGSGRINSGSKRTPQEVYNDLIRKDKERLQRKKMAQLQYQVCPYVCPLHVQCSTIFSITLSFIHGLQNIIDSKVTV